MKQLLRVCFIGVGSIARRHIRNLKQIAKEDSFSVSIDAVRHKPSNEDFDELRHIERVFYDCNDIPSYDAIFITNPTEFHMDVLQRVRGKATAYFIEKPITSVHTLVDAEQDEFVDAPFCYVACPLRYKAVIQSLRDVVNEEEIYAVRTICSSYLPDWRPGQDYRKTYSAQKALGGGVSIDLIHEWDYLRFLFGTPLKIQSVIGKKSTLEIDTEDSALYLAEYADKFLELHLDYFGRQSIRECMLFTKDDTIVADLINNRLSYLKSGKTQEFSEQRDDFQKAELRHFLQIVNGMPSDSTIREAIATLKLTQGTIG